MWTGVGKKGVSGCEEEWRWGNEKRRRRKLPRGVERSATPEHIKYFMSQRVVWERQEDGWPRRLSQLIYTHREREEERERELEPRTTQLQNDSKYLH